MAKINREAGGCLVDIRSILHEALLSSPVLHVDEAGFQVREKRHWLYVASNDQAYPKRGKEAMDDIRLLPRYRGTMVHDAWIVYFLLLPRQEVFRKRKRSLLVAF